MIASWMIVAVPTRAVQLSWLRERDANHADVGLLVEQRDQTATTEVRPADAKNDRPTTPADNLFTKLIVLSLERSSQGWRVVVPTTALEHLTLPKQ